MIVKGELIIDQLSDNYASPACKLSRMTEKGTVVRLKRNLYETDPTTPPYLVAGDLYGPSYISFEYALSLYEVIPEYVCVVTSATCNKHRTKRFVNTLGAFHYYDIPPAAFDVGIETWSQDGREYRIASMPKAVCDKLYKMPPTRSVNRLEELMFDDLRFDMDEIESIDPDIIETYTDLYRSTNIRTLHEYLRGLA